MAGVAVKCGAGGLALMRARGLNIMFRWTTFDDFISNFIVEPA